MLGVSNVWRGSSDDNTNDRVLRYAASFPK